MLSKNNSPQTSVPCLVQGLPFTIHIHPELTVEIDGKPQTVPRDIGIGGVCERALHTHDGSGQIHIESQIQRDYTLGDFFTVWGEKIEKQNYTLTMLVDEKPSTEFGKLVLKDNQKIKLIYKSNKE